MTPRSCEGAAVHGCIGATVVLGGPWVSLLTEHEGTPTSTASPCVIVRGVGIGMQSFRAWEQVSPLWHPCWEGKSPRCGTHAGKGWGLTSVCWCPWVACMLGEGTVHGSVWRSWGWGGRMQRSESGRRSFDGDLSAKWALKRILDFLPAFATGTHRLTSPRRY